jgi:TPP-dependent pyruvate/acetoin dehydrogenase alpha subunit
MPDQPATGALGWSLFETMLLMRRFEEAVALLARQGAFSGHYHLYIGQEATGAGAMAALEARDRVVTTHRNHGHIVARGADLGAALAEILGRATGLNRGRGGTLHLCEPSLGFLSTSGIVGGAISLAVGGGYACRQLGAGAVTAAFFGDGALEEGIAFEALNIAALWKLPVVFICEYNSAEAWGMARGGYPTLVHAADDLTGIPRSLGIEAIRVEGIDPLAVNAAVSVAATRCRAGSGPVFIEAMTKRWAGSAPLWPELSTGITDLNMALGEMPADGPHRDWYADNDPVLRLARHLLASDPACAKRIREIDAKTQGEVGAAVEFAVNSPLPGAETALDFVFA